jgi:hypothetical protein
MRKRSRFPISIPPNERNPADIILEELSEATNKPDSKEEDRSRSWISMETWKLIDMKADARRVGNEDRIKELKKRVH